MAGNDRKLQMALEQSFQDQLGSPNSDRLSISPFGPLTDRLSRQTLIYLITTLNCAFPYYDFSYVTPLKPTRRWSWTFARPSHRTRLFLAIFRRAPQIEKFDLTWKMVS